MSLGEGDTAPDLGRLRPFVVDGCLHRLPAKAARRLLVLRHISERTFDAGREYGEGEVNALLRRWTDGGLVDHVALRRYLVDRGMLARADGTYWVPTPNAPASPDLATRRVLALGLN